MGFSRQEYWSGLPFPSPVDRVLSEFFTVTRPSWMAIHGMAHSFIELDKAVVHVISLISFLWLWFSFCLPSWVRIRGLQKLPGGRDWPWGNWVLFWWVGLCSVQFSHSVVSNSLWPHGLQHARLPCPSPAPRVCSQSCPLSQWCHPTISSSVIPFFSCLQSFPASGSFQMSQLFASGGQSFGISASTSVLPMNI